MAVKNDLLGYPRYVIYQDPEMFHFSIDSILLADFVRIKKNTKTILDLGTGNGAIPMFLTLKTKAHIHAIEIQKPILELARKSIEENKLGNQITLHLGDMKKTHEFIKGYLFDIVVCNPPFFKLHETSNLNKNQYLTAARHEVLITLEEVIKVSYKHLNQKGSLFIIHKPDRLTDLLYLLRINKLEPKRMRFVYPKEYSEPNHVLIEAIKGGEPSNLEILAPLVVYDSNNKWTDDILKIYNYGKEDYEKQTLNQSELIKS